MDDTSAVAQVNLEGNATRRMLVGCGGSLDSTGLALRLFLGQLEEQQWGTLEDLLRNHVEWYYSPGRINYGLT
jgi:hypothetical protein